MTPPNPQVRFSGRSRSRLAIPRWTAVVGLALLFALTGCKSRGGGGSVDGGGPGKRYDPLVHDPRIPPQNVPLPDRGGIGTRVRDPLTKPTGNTSAEKPIAGYSAGPERFQGSFNPSEDSTPAALASKLPTSDELKIDSSDNRVPLRHMGDVQPAGNIEKPDTGLDPLYAELAKFGMIPTSRSLVQEPDGKFTFRASVQISPNGARSEYQGVGETANEAVKEVLDQVVLDRK